MKGSQKLITIPKNKGQISSYIKARKFNYKSMFKKSVDNPRVLSTLF
jgi:hypothetical protein